jgi:hypothetical protein
MPITASPRRPVFRVHDRHPVLRGLSALVLCAVFILSFILTLPQGIGGLGRPQVVAGRAVQRGS